MTHKNKVFVSELAKNLQAAVADLSASTPQAPLYEEF